MKYFFYCFSLALHVCCSIDVKLGSMCFECTFTIHTSQIPFTRPLCVPRACAEGAS